MSEKERARLARSVEKARALVNSGNYEKRNLLLFEGKTKFGLQIKSREEGVGLLVKASSITPSILSKELFDKIPEWNIFDSLIG